MGPTDYGWFGKREHPVAWLRVACCFTWVRGLSASQIAEHAALLDPKDVDLTPIDDLGSALWERKIAMYTFDDGWVLGLHPNGSSFDIAARLLASPLQVPEMAVAWWSGHGQDEFSYWRNKRLIVSFDPLFPTARSGSQDVENVSVALRRVGLDEADPPEQYRESMLALLDHITGHHLADQFWAARAIVADPPD